MSHDETISAGITSEGYKAFRLLTYCVVYLAVLCSPIAVLAAAVYGWRTVEYVIFH